MHALALLLLSQPLAISSALELDPRVDAAAGGLQHAVSLASDGDGWFAVWSDDRMWNQELGRFNFAEWIYGAHVGADGVISPAASMYLAGDTMSLLSMPAITGHNGGFALAYVDSYSRDDQILLQRLDPAGLPIGSKWVLATSTASFGIAELRGHDLGAGEALIIWVENFGGGDHRLNLTTIDADGAIIRSHAHAIPSWYFAVDCTTEQCTVLDSYNLGLRATEINLVTGVATAPLHIDDVGFPHGTGRIADTTIVIYGNAFRTLSAKRYTNGVVLDAQPILIAGDVDGEVRVATRDTDVIIAWESNSIDVLHSARIDAAGAILDPAPFTVATYDHFELEAIVWNSNLVLISGTGGDVYSEPDIVAARIEPDGLGAIDTAAQPISRAVNRQTAPAIAYGAGVYLLAWEDNRTVPPQIMAMRLDSAGARIGEPFAIAETRAQVRPSVDFDGSLFWIAWSSTQEAARAVEGADFDVHAARVASDGTRLDSTPRVIAASGDKEVEADVVCAASSCFIVWRDWDRRTARLARVLSDGTVLDPDGLLACELCEDLDFAYDGERLIAVYESTATGSAGPLMMRRFALDGTPIDEEAIRVNVYDSAWSNDDVALAGGTNTSTVVLRWYGSSGPHTITIDGTGEALRVINSCERCATIGAEAGSITFDGRDFVVAAGGYRDDEYPSQRIFATRVSTAAESLESAAVEVSRAAFAWSPAASASDGCGHTLVARSAYDEDPNVLSPRLEAFLLTNPRVECVVAPDAGVAPDVGFDDAAVIDAGVANDGGVSDAGVAMANDATVTPSPELEEEDACSCATTTKNRGSLAFAALIFVACCGLRKRKFNP